MLVARCIVDVLWGWSKWWIHIEVDVRGGNKYPSARGGYEGMTLGILVLDFGGFDWSTAKEG